MRALAMAVLLSAVALAPAAIARASEPGEYTALIRKALREYELGNFDEAKAYFVRAHAIEPSARTMRGLGMSCYELREYAEAITWYEQAQRSAVRPLTAAMQREAARALTEARSFVSYARVAVAPEDALLRVDGKPARRDAAGRVLLDPGPHELAASAPGHEPAMRTLEGSAGEQLSVSITLRAAGAERPGSGGRSGGGAAPFVVIGVAGGLVVAGSVMTGIALSDVSAVEDAADGTRWPTVRDGYESSPELSAIGLTMVAVGAAGLAAGLLWAFWPEDEASTGAALRIGPGFARVEGRF
jgi:hypothetical protein